ncbi:hypothetical protein LO772_01830 [Yinghuangia sp. ASG 101]|uniref:hypothetical protein n=1 Tax=Yinghuangia sp. ASG 101 TaxID=2896848 RepID=UPI001E3A18BB|nr:hypothetical protein [Yinghuangia sp. ASG 101]UGQ12378.1 hypothetical protein LO772_01830 [Yinghuangia sp. ASG 101]
MTPRFIRPDNARHDGNGTSRDTRSHAEEPTAPGAASAPDHHNDGGVPADDPPGDSDADADDAAVPRGAPPPRSAEPDDTTGRRHDHNDPTPTTATGGTPTHHTTRPDKPTGHHDNNAGPTDTTATPDTPAHHTTRPGLPAADRDTVRDGDGLPSRGPSGRADPVPDAPATADTPGPSPLVTAGERGVAGAGRIGVAVTGDRNLVAPRALVVSVRGGRTPADDGAAVAQSLGLLASAVGAEWHRESGRRGLYRPAPLPVPLRVTSGPLAEAGRADTVTTSAELLRATPNGRLVVTGPRGAGKTTCAMLLVDALLREPVPGEPVPVLLSLSSWDPEHEDVRAWIARRIADDYAGALAEFVSADALVSGRHLLPVLDGLEEIAADKRVLALRRVGEAFDSRDPLVLTCTTPEFDTVLADGGVPPAGASVVALGDTPLGDVAAYLRPEFGGNAWDDVLPLLAERPGMRRLVGHPLTVALLRTRYELPDRDPRELLDVREFPDAEAVESRLLDDVVPAAFTPRPADARSTSRPLRRWPVPLAERWLRQLAPRAGNGQLRWWEFSEPVLRRSPRPALLGALLAVVWFAVAMALVHTVGGRPVDAGVIVEVSLMAGAVALVFAASFGDAPAAPRPFWQRIERVPGRVRRARRMVFLFVRHMVVGLVGVCGAVVVVGFALQAYNGMVTTPEECAQIARVNHTDHCLVPNPVQGVNAGWAGPTPGEAQEVRPDELNDHHLDWQAFLDAVPTLIAVGLVAVFLLFVYGLLAPAPGGAAFPTPRSSLAGARRRLLGALAFQCLGLAVAAVVLASLVRPSRTTACLGALVIATVVPWTMSRSAWGRYHVAHWALALRGRVPWRLMAFCEDAHRLEVLRQAGSAYEFRHEALRGHLLRKPEDGAPSRAG